nr:uncharacterized protein C19orf57 homolog isoform X2 [Equus caballus]
MTPNGQVSQGRETMTKRRKLRTSGGEGIHTPRPPKNPRLGDSAGAPRSSQVGHVPHPEELEGSPGQAPSAEQSREEPEQSASSSPEEEAGAPSRLLGQPDEEPAPFPPSQNSVGRFVPQFAKPRRTVRRQAAMREEDLGSGACGSETLPEPSAQEADSQPREEAPGLSSRAAGELGDQTQADSACPEHSSQSAVEPVPRSGDPQPSASTDACAEWGTVVSASERASQGHLWEQSASAPDGGSTEPSGVLGEHGQKGHLPSTDAEEKEPDPGAPQEGGAPGGAGADLPEGHQEEGGGVLGPAPRGLLDPVQTPSGAGGETEQSCGSPGPSSLGTVVVTAMSTDPAEPEQRAPEVAKPGGAPASPGRKAPKGGHGGALLRGTPVTQETTRGRGEAGHEDEPPGDIPGVPAASLPLAQGTQAPTVGAGESSPLVQEAGPGVHQTLGPGPDGEGLGGVCAPPVLWQPESGRRSRKQDLGASTPPAHRGAVGGLTQEMGVIQGSPDGPRDPTGQPEDPPDSADQFWGGSLAVDLDFLPDSQMRAALEGPDFEAPPAQLFPVGSGLAPCWPGPGPRADGGPLTGAQLRALCGVKACEAARMEDATDTVHGLILELSNLNRLVMSTHRDLEAIRRLPSRRARPARKGPAPCTAKAVGGLHRGEQSWRDV